MPILSLPGDEPDGWRTQPLPGLGGRERAAAASLLLPSPRWTSSSATTACALPAARELEIAVVDGERRFGNGMLLPAGPLRDAPAASVDAVVVNAGATHGLPHAFGMRLTGELFVNLREPARVRLPREFAGMSVHAAAGIGNPQRFFATLVDLGVQFAPHAFPDHYAYRPEDLAFPGADAVLLTEKDAVKCAAFARESFWFLPVEAEVDPALGKLILDRIETRHGRQAA